MRYFIPMNEATKDEIVEDYTNGVSVNKIATANHICTATLYKILQERGISKRHKEHKPQKPRKPRKQRTKKVKVVQPKYQQLVIDIATEEYIEHLLQLMRQAYQMQDHTQSVVHYGINNFERLIKQHPFNGQTHYQRVVTVKL